MASFCVSGQETILVRAGGYQLAWASLSGSRSQPRGISGESWNSTVGYSLCHRNRPLGVRSLLLRADGPAPGERGQSLPGRLAPRSAHSTRTGVSSPGAPGVSLVCNTGPRDPGLDQLTYAFINPTGCFVTMSRRYRPLGLPEAPVLVVICASWGYLAGDWARYALAGAVDRAAEAGAPRGAAVYLLAVPGCPNTVIGGPTHAARPD
jgi:hypothetical protein